MLILALEDVHSHAGWPGTRHAAAVLGDPDLGVFYLALARLAP